MILDDYITACIQLHLVLNEKSANNFHQKIRKTLYYLQFADFFYTYNDIVRRKLVRLSVKSFTSHYPSPANATRAPSYR
jgi:hypothetical protein